MARGVKPFSCSFAAICGRVGISRARAGESGFPSLANQGSSDLWEFRRSPHSALSSNTYSDSIVVTHLFHPLRKQRLRILFERRRAGRRVYICESGESTVTLAEDWTDRGEPPGSHPLTYEQLAELGEVLSAIKAG
jgi:hypothetical protein